MNKIILRGTISDIKYSHSIGTTEYDKAILKVENSDSTESLINLRFKHNSNYYFDGDDIILQGNLRSYSHSANGKNKVDLYVFTYLDLLNPETEYINFVEIDGRVCSITPIRKNKDGTILMSFILANNIFANTNKLSSYIPCICKNDLAKNLLKVLIVNSKIHIFGELRSRDYTKLLDNGNTETHTTYEVIVSDYLLEE